MFSQDFFLAIILQDTSPGEGQHGAGCDVGWGYQREQRWQAYSPGTRMECCRSRRGGVYITDMESMRVHGVCVCLCICTKVAEVGNLLCLSVFPSACACATHIYVGRF